MKQGIHPNYHDVDVQCACGETFKTRSTYNGDVIKIDICSKCHPFYSGKKKVVDSEGRVERFKKRYNLN